MTDTLRLMVDYSENDLASYYFNILEIRLNLKIIKESCDEYNSDFYTLLLHVINHEVLHHVLHVEQGAGVSTALDNLTHYKQNDENVWEYWIS
jgi:predicted SprT family Zn-dependent metalloprotease